MHLQCSRMPAKVYYELLRRFGTRNIFNKNTGMDFLGGSSPSSGQRGAGGGAAIFHDKAKNY